MVTFNIMRQAEFSLYLKNDSVMNASVSLVKDLTEGFYVNVKHFNRPFFKNSFGLGAEKEALDNFFEISSTLQDMKTIYEALGEDTTAYRISELTGIDYNRTFCILNNLEGMDIVKSYSRGSHTLYGKER